MTWRDVYRNPDTGDAGDAGLVVDGQYDERAMVLVKGMAVAVSTGAVSGMASVTVQLL